MEKFTKEKLLKILNEELNTILRESDPIESSDSTMIDYSSLSSSMAENGLKLDPAVKDHLNQKISQTLSNGRPIFDYNYFDKDRDGFIYYTDALATIAKKDMSGSENAKNALMIIFGPFSEQSSTYNNASGEKELGKQKMSKFFVRVNRFAANHIDLKGKDSIYFVNDMNTDNLLNAFYIGFEKALKYFNPELKKSFNSFVSTAIANAKIDIWRHQNQYKVNGEKLNKKTTSLDNPLDNDDSDAGTLGDTIASPDMSTDRTLEKNRAKKIWMAIDTFIKRVINFEFPKNDEYEKIYDMYTNHDMDLDEISQALNIKNGNIRIMKMRAEDAVKEYIQDGTMAQFVSQVTGENIKDIPFVQGKGTTNMRFVFPRVKESLKKSLKESEENYFENIITLLEEEFILNTTSFYNESEEPEWTEYALEILKESNEKFAKMEKIYNKLKNIKKSINEGYDGNYNVDVLDLFEHIKGFVEESQKIISVLFDEVYKIENVAYNIHKDYPLVATELDKTVQPIIKNLEEWPNKLSIMLRDVRQKYNPTNAYGL